MPITTQYKEKNGFVHVPLRTFKRMKKAIERLEDQADEAALQNALDNAEEYLPGEVVKRLVNGESPVRVYREHRGMTQQDLADAIGKSKTTISEIESGRKRGSIDVYKDMATVMKVDIDDLV